MRFFFRRIAIFIIIPIIVVASIELISRAVKVPKIVHFNTDAKGQDLVPQIDSNTILLCGDSRLEWGIRPTVIDSLLCDKNIKVIDLAIPGSNGLDILTYLDSNRIYPKLIIMGYTSNYGRYTNFNFEKTNYNLLKKTCCHLKHYFKSHYYVCDKSLIEYAKHKCPYFKNIWHDSLGGATIQEYGGYSERQNYQIDLYNFWKYSFSNDELKKYGEQLNSLISDFHGKSPVIGVYMPVSNTIYKIENSDSTFVDSLKFDRFYNFRDYTYTNELPQPDSAFFIDGSHLTYLYSKEFTEELFKIIGVDSIIKLSSNIN